jgi:hypothetical protein
VVQNGCLPHFKNTDSVTLHQCYQFVYVDTEQVHGLELMAPEEYMLAEREAATPAGRIRIVGDQNGVAVVGVGGNRIVNCPAKACIDHTPAFMPKLSKERTDCLGIDVFIEHEAHLRNR